MFGEKTKPIIFAFIYICTVMFVGIRANHVIAENPVEYVHYREEQNVLAQLVSSDSVHYLNVARNGYEGNQILTAFFPLFPLIISVFSILVSSPVFAGFVISWFSLLAAVYIFTALLRTEKMGVLRDNSLLFLLAFPTAFFFIVPYTESLFFLLSIGTVYLIKSERYVWAGVVGGLATAARIHGILLLIFALFVWFRELRNKNKNLKSVFLLLIPGGLFVYMAYLYAVFGDPIKFIESQKAWGHFGADYIGRIMDGFGPMTAIVLLTLGVSVFQLWRNKKYDYAIYAAVFLAPALISGNLNSLSRYVLGAFPMFIGLALLFDNKFLQPYRKLAILIMAVLQGYYITLFVNGYWVA